MRFYFCNYWILYLVKLNKINTLEIIKIINSKKILITVIFKNNNISKLIFLTLK